MAQEANVFGPEAQDSRHGSSIKSPSAGWSHVIFDAIDRCADKSEPKNLPDAWNELLLPIGIFGMDCKQMLEGAAAD